jgi:hypothetical protein
MRRIIAALLIALTCSVGLGAVHGAGAADPGAEIDFATRVNALRASVGVGPLGLHPVLTAKAEAWAAHMAATGCLCHSNLSDGVTVGWRKLGENIGRGPSVASIHDALVHSSLHYANMVDGSFHWIGVGVAYGGGGMYVAEVFMDGDAPVPTGPAWRGWDGLGGSSASAPASASWAPNRLDVFANWNGGLAHRWWDGRSWSPVWENLGSPPGGLTGSPTAVSWGTNRIDVFGRAGDGSLAHRWWDGSRWRGWESLGGGIASSPSVASWGSNRLDVFATRADGALLHRKFSSKWSSWESLGGQVVGDPAAVSWGPNRVDVFVRGTDSALWHRWYSGGWSGWEGLGGVLTSSPSAGAWSAGRVDLFARGTDAGLWHRWYAAGWSGWEGLGGALTAAPGAVSWGPNRIDVFVRGLDAGVWHRWWN